MGQDTEIMSRYTLSKAPANGTETITFTVPDWEVQERQGDPDNPTLTVRMGFSSDEAHKLPMTGYGDSSDFADGLEIVDATKALEKLTFTLGSGWPPKGWKIQVDSCPVLDGPNSTTGPIGIPENGEFSVVISMKTSDGHTITTGDPKIKVIRPTS